MDSFAQHHEDHSMLHRSCERVELSAGELCRPSVGIDEVHVVLTKGQGEPLRGEVIREMEEIFLGTYEVGLVFCLDYECDHIEVIAREQAERMCREERHLLNMLLATAAEEGLTPRDLGLPHGWDLGRLFPGEYIGLLAEQMSPTIIATHDGRDCCVWETIGLGLGPSFCNISRVRFVDIAEERR